jgi:hypothetical protein
MAHQARVKLTDVAVCLIQLSVTSPCVPAYYLHKHLCALHHARNHGPQPAWVLRDILEMRSDWRTSKPVR